MADDNKKRKPGRPRGSKNKTALVRLDKAATAAVAQVSALKAEDKLYTLGKDRLAEIDNIMMNLALAYSPVGRINRRGGDRVLEKILDQSTIDLKKIKMAHGGIRSWRRGIRLCGRFPYRPTIGGACGMYRPPISPVSAKAELQ